MHFFIFAFLWGNAPAVQTLGIIPVITLLHPRRKLQCHGVLPTTHSLWLVILCVILTCGSFIQLLQTSSEQRKWYYNNNDNKRKGMPAPLSFTELLFTYAFCMVVSSIVFMIQDHGRHGANAAASAAAAHSLQPFFTLL